MFIAYPQFIAGDQAVRSLDQLPGRPVVFLKIDLEGGFHPVGKSDYVLDLRATEPVYALIVVTHHEQVACFAGYLPEYAVLHGVGILVFIHQYVTVSRADGVQDAGIVQQSVHIGKDHGLVYPARFQHGGPVFRICPDDLMVKALAFTQKYRMIPRLDLERGVEDLLGYQVVKLGDLLVKIDFPDLPGKEMLGFPLRPPPVIELFKPQSAGIAVNEKELIALLGWGERALKEENAVLIGFYKPVAKRMYGPHV